MATAAEKAQETKRYKAARAIAAQITALPSPVSDEAVLEVLRAQTCSKRILSDAFWLLDNEPRRFADQQVWHPRLRSLRNHPEGGERMFALFQ